jgi:hypothetical protein
MKKIVFVLAVLVALVAMPAARGFAAPPQAVGSFHAHLSGDGNYQGEAQFALTKCSSGLWYKVVLGKIPAGVSPVIHLHIMKGGNKYLIGYLTPDSIPFQWDHYGFDGMLRSLNPLGLSANLLEPAGIEPEDLYINLDTQAYHFRPLEPLVEDYLIPGNALVDVHFLKEDDIADETDPDLSGITSGQSNTVW